MARIRTIKPDFWDDEKLSILPLQARLVFIGTWNLSDDFGIVKSNPAWIRSRLFPYDESIRTQDVLKWLNALQEARMLIPLNHKGESYYKIRTFEAHQVINRPGERTIPKAEEAEMIGVSDNSLNDHGTFTEDSLSDHGILTAGKEGKGKEGKGKERSPEKMRDGSPGRPPRRPQETDDQFLESLKSNPAYAHVDFAREMGKIEAWRAVNPNRQITRKFLVNWLNRIEKPLSMPKKQSGMEEFLNEP